MLIVDPSAFLPLALGQDPVVATRRASATDDSAGTAPADRPPADQPAAGGARAHVPPLLDDLAGWAWRTLLVAFALYVVLRVLGRFHLVVLPFIGAMFITALLLPFVRWLTDRGLRRGVATALVMVGGLAVLGLIGWYITDQATSQYNNLADQLSGSLHRVRNALVNGPFHVQAKSVDNLQNTVTKWLNSHRSSIASGVVTGISVLSEALVGLVLALFSTFFLLYDGRRIWRFCAHLLPRSGRARADLAAVSAWERISGYVRGTFLVACFHGIVIGVSLAAMGVPLVAPLALLVFLGSFIPIVGVVIFGGLAVLVTFGTKGLVLALVLLGILLVANQIESHVLQPFLVGRYVHLHPLAVALAITAGSVLGGIVGAILAVPVVSAADAVIRSLARSESVPDGAAVSD